MWYRVIHDIVPTGNIVHNIRIVSTNACITRSMPDTLRHRIMDCGEGWYQREWTRRRLALMLRTDPRWVPEECLFRPHLNLCPTQRHRAVLWTIAHLAAFWMQRARTVTFQDFIDFLRRSKWKLYQQRNRMARVGNYLCALDL
jgi:hypothetical protein